MKLSRTIAYAIHAMICLSRAAPGLPVPCRRLAREGEMPERFLLQILRVLVRRDLLRSTRGVEGGYVLSRSADQISLRDILEAFDGPLRPAVPAIGGLANGARTELLKTLGNVADAARIELQKVTIAELAALSNVDDVTH
jgi:Rrf2 family protein